MPDVNRDALLAQALDIGAIRGIRTLNAIAERIEHLGDSRHADAADADEMDGAEFARQLHASNGFLFGASRHGEDEIGEPLRGIGAAVAAGRIGTQ